MPRIRIDTFNRGLYASPPPSHVPTGGLARATGVHPVQIGPVRSRAGSTRALAAAGGNIHSLYRYKGSRFSGRGTDLYKEAASIKSGLDGTRLAFATMAPTIGKDAFLFCAGGGALFKVSPTGAVTGWGISAPLTNPTAAAGAAGALTGTYQYLVTFLNTTSGHRSNSNPTAATVTLAAQKGSLTAIPTSPDAQVNARELWRTIAGGSLFFRLDAILDNVTTTYTDNLADWGLGLEELPTDNITWPGTMESVAGPHLARMWACGNNVTGERGRVFYTPPARPEALSSFVNVSSDDDPTQRVVIWNRTLWVFTRDRIFSLTTFTEPFIFVEVGGAPGTTNVNTIVPTPFGIYYHANDGVRRFNGLISALVNSTAMERLFRGESVPSFPSFKGVIAAYGRGEYIISDLETVLAVNAGTDVWRRVGFDKLISIFYEQDLDSFIASPSDKGGGIFTVEDEIKRDDDGNGIYFEVETPAVWPDPDRQAIVHSVSIEAESDGAAISVTPTVVIDLTRYIYPAVSFQKRSVVNLPVDRAGRTISVRVAATATARITVHSIEIDYYLPGEESSELTPASQVA